MIGRGCAVLALGVLAVMHQDPYPVELFVTATNARANAVTDLRAADFEIMDGGKAADIVAFQAGPRTVSGVVVFDVSSSMARVGEPLNTLAAMAGSLLKDGDRLRVATVAGRSLISPAPVATRRELIAAAASLTQPHGPTPLWDALATVMDTLAGESGRRVIVVYTDGRANSNAIDASSVMLRAMAEGVLVYFVCPEETEVAAPGLMPAGDLLERFARETGGARLIAGERVGGRGASNFGAAYVRLMSELRSQYSMTFTSSVRDGSLRPIEIRVRRQGVTARTRTAYRGRSK